MNELTNLVTTTVNGTTLVIGIRCVELRQDPQFHATVSGSFYLLDKASCPVSDVLYSGTFIIPPRVNSTTTQYPHVCEVLPKEAFNKEITGLYLTVATASADDLDTPPLEEWCADADETAHNKAKVTPIDDIAVAFDGNDVVKLEGVPEKINGATEAELPPAKDAYTAGYETAKKEALTELNRQFDEFTRERDKLEKRLVECNSTKDLAHHLIVAIATDEMHSIANTLDLPICKEDCHELAANTVDKLIDIGVINL